MTTLFTAGQQPVLSDTTVEAFADLGYSRARSVAGSAYVALDNPGWCDRHGLQKPDRFGWPRMTGEAGRQS